MMKKQFSLFLLTATCSLFLLFIACTQGKDTEEVGKGVTQDAGDSCEGSQADNVLCKWVIDKFQVDVDLPPPNPDIQIEVDFQVNQQGKITKIISQASAGTGLQQTMEQTRTFNSQGLLETEGGGEQGMDGLKTYQYNSDGKVSTLTHVLTYHDPTNPSFPVSPITTTHTYDYSPPPPHQIFITVEEKDKNGTLLSSQEKGIVLNAEGNPETQEVVTFDPAHSPTGWTLYEYTYRDGRTRTLLETYQACNSPSPCNTAGGTSALLPTSMDKYSFEFDNRGRLTNFSSEGFGGYSVPLTGTPNSTTSCNIEYEIDSEIPMAHVHPLKFQSDELWSRLQISDNDLMSKMICEITQIVSGAPPETSGVTLTFTWKRLWEVLGEPKPS